MPHTNAARRRSSTRHRCVFAVFIPQVSPLDSELIDISHPAGLTAFLSAVEAYQRMLDEPQSAEEACTDALHSEPDVLSGRPATPPAGTVKPAIDLPEAPPTAPAVTDIIMAPADAPPTSNHIASPAPGVSGAASGSSALPPSHPQSVRTASTDAAAAAGQGHAARNPPATPMSAGRTLVFHDMRTDSQTAATPPLRYAAS